MRFGLHLSVSGGLMKTLKEAEALGIDCLQVFSGNPRGWARKDLDKDLAAGFQDAAARAGINPVVLHAPYLINLASAKDELWQKSIAAMADQLNRAALLGAKAVVVHPGSRGGKDLDWGVRRLCRGVARALDQARGDAQCWLENTPGGGGHLGGPLSQLAWMLKELKGYPVNICLDTCHAWGAGYHLDSEPAVCGFLKKVDKTLGLKRVKLWHFNDSLCLRGSRKDQHTHLGKGEIGPVGLAALASDKRLLLSPAVMETPKDSPRADKRNLAYARRLGEKPRKCAQ